MGGGKVEGEGERGEGGGTGMGKGRRRERCGPDGQSQGGDGLSANSSHLARASQFSCFVCWSDDRQKASPRPRRQIKRSAAKLEPN